MDLFIVESRMEVPGGDWLPWDGKGLKTRAEAESVATKLRRKKTAMADYSYRVAAYRCVQTYDSPPSAPLKCDGNHGGPRCGDPECWNQ